MRLIRCDKCGTDVKKGQVRTLESWPVVEVVPSMRIDLCVGCMDRFLEWVKEE